MSYSKKLIDYYKDKSNIGSFYDINYNVGNGLIGAPICGDVIKLQIFVIEDNFIKDAKFKTYGCGSAIAASSLISNYIKGKTLFQALSIKNTFISQELDLPSIKLHCSILVEEVIFLTINDFKNNYIIFK